MDAGTITIICAVLGSSALTTVIQAIVGAAQKKKTQAASPFAGAAGPSGPLRCLRS